MKRRMFLFIFLIIVMVSSFVFAQEKPSGERAKEYIQYLASDELEGRDTGSKGFDKAVEYVIQQYKAWGLTPAGINNSYLQPFPFCFYKNEFEEPLLKIEDRLFYHDDREFLGMTYSGGGSIQTEVVFAGYGISAADQGLDEYADIDVNDKIVLVMHGCPNEDEEKWEPFHFDSAKVAIAQAKGARGLLICAKLTSENRSPGWRWRLKPDNYKEDFIVYKIGERATNYILQNEKESRRSRNRRFGRMQRQLDKQLIPISYATGKKAKMNIKVAYIPQHAGKNVFAKIQGSDPEVGSEVIVLGAHLDHLGIQYGEVYNGADDNASGSSIVMEVARTMMTNQIQPKRTIVFALWGGEERGLLGSKYYVEHPLLPIEKTVLNFNMDMVGLGKTCSFAGIYYAPYIWDIVNESTPDSVMEFIDESRGGPGGSDHTPFLENGVPAYFLITRPWSAHPYYHQPQDDTQPIDVELLKKTANFVYNNALRIANYEGNLLYPNRKANYIYKSSIIANINSIPYKPGEAILDSLQKKNMDIQFFYIQLDEKQNFLAQLTDQLDTFYQDTLMGSHGDVIAWYLFNDDREETDPFIGIRDVKSIHHSLQALRIAGKMGAKFFTFVGSDGDWLSETSGLTKEGKEAIYEMDKQKMMVLLDNVPEVILFSVLHETKSPIIIITDQAIQSDSLLSELNESKSILGIRYCPKRDIDSLVTKILKLKEKINLSKVVLVPEVVCGEKIYCLDQILDVVIQLEKEGITQKEINGLLGENLEDIYRDVFEGN